RGGAEPGERGPERQVLQRGQVLVDIRAVGDQPDVAPHALGVLRAVVARHHGGAPGRTHEGREDLEQRRLARAVGAQHRQRFALVDVEVEALQHTMLAKGLTETGHSNEWICGHALNFPIVAQPRGPGQGSDSRGRGSLTRATPVPNSRFTVWSWPYPRRTVDRRAVVPLRAVPSAVVVADASGDGARDLPGHARDAGQPARPGVRRGDAAVAGGAE